MPRANTNRDTFAHQRLGDAAADAFAAPGNDCDFVLQIHAFGVPPSGGILRLKPPKGATPTYFNLSRSRSFTIFGFALPFDAFITWPTKKPKSVSFPDRYCSS